MILGNELISITSININISDLPIFLSFWNVHFEKHEQ